MSKLKKRLAFILTAILVTSLMQPWMPLVAEAGTTAAYYFTGTESEGRFVLKVEIEHSSDNMAGGNFILKYDKTKLVLLKQVIAEDDTITYPECTTGNNAFVPQITTDASISIVDENNAASSNVEKGFLWVNWYSAPNFMPTEVGVKNTIGYIFFDFETGVDVSSFDEGTVRLDTLGEDITEAELDWGPAALAGGADGTTLFTIADANLNNYFDYTGSGDAATQSQLPEYGVIFNNSKTELVIAPTGGLKAGDVITIYDSAVDGTVLSSMTVTSDADFKTISYNPAQLTDIWITYRANGQDESIRYLAKTEAPIITVSSSAISPTPVLNSIKLTVPTPDGTNRFYYRVVSSIPETMCIDDVITTDAGLWTALEAAETEITAINKRYVEVVEARDDSGIIKVVKWGYTGPVSDGTGVTVSGTVNYVGTIAATATLYKVEGAVETLIATTSALKSGGYEFDSVQDGEYKIVITKKNHTKGTALFMVIGDPKTISLLTLLGGDLDGNNTINIGDYGMLTSKYRQTYPSYDIDENNVINIGDYGILTGNYRKTGAIIDTR